MANFPVKEIEYDPFETYYLPDDAFDGTAVRQTIAVPQPAEEEVVSTRTRKNRVRSLSMSRGYVAFLAMMTVMAVLMCIYYLQLREMVTAQKEVNAELESRLTRLTSENDALYEEITNQISWEHIRLVAERSYDMHYPSQGQVIWYNRDAGSYVRQYQTLPSDGG